MRIALYEPEIAGNLGTILRSCACMGVPLDIIEPCGFPLGDRQLRRAAMDYLDNAHWTRHRDWDDFLTARRVAPARLILFSRKAATPIQEFGFACDDILLFGSESAGVPASVHALADARVTITMHAGMRSLNLAVSVGMGLFEALRQTGQLPR
jgi:tRNA (cytidine/uridine-2'-O-)-methyltransferase